MARPTYRPDLRLIDNGTIAGLQDIGSKVQNPRAMVAAVIGRGRQELIAHFRQRNQQPNKVGGPRENFWNRIADSVTTVIVSPTEGKISVTDHRFNQKVYGGRITPKQKESLAFGVAPESYGRSTATFEAETGLKLFRLKRSGGVLTNLLMANFGGGNIKIEYVISKGVNQDPDPEALPDREKFNAALLDAADKYLTREVIQNKTTTS